MGFRNHLIAYHIEHGTTGHTQQRRKEHPGQTSQDETYPYSKHFQQRDSGRYGKRPAETHANHQQRRDNHHPFGYILQRDTYSNRIGIRKIVFVEHNPGSHPFWKLMDGYCDNEHHYPVNGGVPFMLLDVKTGKMMKVRSEIVQHSDKRHSGCDTGNHLPPP